VAPPHPPISKEDGTKINQLYKNNLIIICTKWVSNINFIVCMMFGDQTLVLMIMFHFLESALPADPTKEKCRRSKTRRSVEGEVQKEK
jgi:hypothetical protein